MQDALTAARRALAAAKAHAEGSRALESENYPVAEIVARLDRRIEALEPGRGVSTEEWFAELPAPERRVTLFLALLELARLQRIFGVMPVSLRNVVPKWLWLEKPISSEMSARLICVAGDRSSLDLAADQALVFCPADQQVLFGGRQTQVAGVLCLHRRQ